MIPWPKFLVLMRQIPRLEAADVLLTANGVTYGYLNARTGKSDRGRWKLDLGFRKLRRAAFGEEAED